MISHPRQLNDLIGTLTTATWTLTAISTLFESGLAEALREPRTLDELAARVDALPRERLQRCLDVAASRGLIAADGDRFALSAGVLPFTGDPLRTDLLGEMRSALMQALAYTDAAARGTPTRGWHHTDPRILQAQGDSSTGFAGALAQAIAPALSGLSERLAQPSARILDVGVGVAALSIALCRTFPAVRVVGIDVFDVPLSMARDNVARARLTDRIELRQLAAQELRDEATFDFAWVPSFFLAPSTIPAAFARVRASLKPGGWLLIPTVDADAPELERVVGALITEQWGAATDSETTERQLRDAGFATIVSLPGPGWVKLVAAQS